MLPESALWGSKKARWADCYLCDSFSAWQAACEPGNWTGLWCFVEEVGEEEVEEQEGEQGGKLGRWRTAPNNWDTAWLTWRSWAPTLKDWPLPVSWLHCVVCLSVCLSLNLSPPALSCVLPHTVKLCNTFSAIDSVSCTVSYCFYKCMSQWCLVFTYFPYICVCSGCLSLSKSVNVCWWERERERASKGWRYQWEWERKTILNARWSIIKRLNSVQFCPLDNSHVRVILLQLLQKSINYTFH